MVSCLVLVCITNDHGDRERERESAHKFITYFLNGMISQECHASFSGAQCHEKGVQSQSVLGFKLLTCEWSYIVKL